MSLTFSICHLGVAGGWLRSTVEFSKRVALNDAGVRHEPQDIDRNKWQMNGNFSNSSTSVTNQRKSHLLFSLFAATIAPAYEYRNH